MNGTHRTWYGTNFSIYRMLYMYIYTLSPSYSYIYIYNTYVAIYNIVFRMLGILLNRFPKQLIPWIVRANIITSRATIGARHDGQ